MRIYFRSISSFSGYVDDDDDDDGGIDRALHCASEESTNLHCMTLVSCIFLFFTSSIDSQIVLVCHTSTGHSFL